MARAIWKGTLAFGLVEIPIALHTAERSDELALTLLDKKALTPVHYKRVNDRGDEVEWDDIVRGYPLKKGEFVVLSDQDLKRANVEASQTVQVMQFVDEDEVEPIYFEKPYYLVPTSKAGRSYALFREVLKRTGKMAIATVVIRTRQHLCAVLVRDAALVLITMRYAHEIVDESELDLPKDDLKKSAATATELDIAERLVASMTSKFTPDRYRDTYRDELLKFVRAKAKRGESEVLDESEPEAAAKRRPEVVDLMPLLKQSLASLGRGRRAGRGSDTAAPSKRPRAATAKHPRAAPTRPKRTPSRTKGRKRSA